MATSKDSKSDDEFKKKYFVIRVTQTVDYVFPTYMGAKDKIIKEFFTDFNLNKRHASRDCCEGSKQLLSAVPVDWEVIEKEVAARKGKSDVEA